jgi:hypothetical protein
MLRLEDDEADLVIWFPLWAILSMIDADEEYSIQSGIDSGEISRAETLEVTSHAALPFAGR